jgi:HSP20 family protein
VVEEDFATIADYCHRGSAMNRVIVLRRPVSQRATQRELEDLFRRQWGRPQPTAVRHEEGWWQPPVDVYEVADAFLVLVELAGMRDSQIEVALSEDALLISGLRPELHRDGTLRFHQLSINEGPFQAALLLPGPVADEDITAEYDDGLLTVTLPKRRPQVRHIEVTSEPG